MFPKPHSVKHSVTAGTVVNALGQLVTERGEPRERAVMGWHVTSAHDGGSAVLDSRITTEATLLTDEPDWFDGDVVELPGLGDFVVHGDAISCNDGPFGFTPGYKVMLRRVDHGSS